MTAAPEPLGDGAVYVLMSTYNGARHVAEQVASIQAQTFRDWHLVIRDDGSRDETPAVVRAIAGRDRRVVLLPSDGENRGAAASFGVLLDWARDAGATYVFLADQDDVWRPEKMAEEMAAMRRLEAECGADTPALVHTDLEVVGPELEPVHPSFAAYQGAPTRRARELSRLLVQNVVTGCTVLINRALLEFATPVPRVAMHDMWLAQCAAAAGRIVYLPVATVRYRQHGSNVVGARGRTAMLRAAAFNPASWWARSYRNFLLGVEQAAVLRGRLERLAPGSGRAREAAALIEAYVSAFAQARGPVGRLVRVIRAGVRPQPRLFYVLFLARVAAWGRSRAG